MKVKLKLKTGKHPARKMAFQGVMIGDLEYTELELNEEQAKLLDSEGVKHWFEIKKPAAKKKTSKKK